MMASLSSLSVTSWLEVEAATGKKDDESLSFNYFRVPIEVPEAREVSRKIRPPHQASLNCPLMLSVYFYSWF